MNGLNNFDETDRECSHAPSDDLLDSGGQRSRQAVEVKSCEHHVSWTFSMKLPGYNYWWPGLILEVKVTAYIAQLLLRTSDELDAPVSSKQITFQVNNVHVMIAVEW